MPVILPAATSSIDVTVAIASLAGVAPLKLVPNNLSCCPILYPSPPGFSICILVYSVSDSSTVNVVPVPCLADPLTELAVLPLYEVPVVVYVKIAPLASTLTIVPVISFAGVAPPSPGALPAIVKVSPAR